MFVSAGGLMHAFGLGLLNSQLFRSVPKLLVLAIDRSSSDRKPGWNEEEGFTHQATLVVPVRT